MRVEFPREENRGHSTRNVPLVDRGLIAELRRYLLTHPNSGDPTRCSGRVGEWGRTRSTMAASSTSAASAATTSGPHCASSACPTCGSTTSDHTAASLWLAAGFSTWQVSRRLGHANTNATDAIYAHLYPSDYSDDIANFDALRSRG
ncbi:hypothetical protein [uncultured Amnibacterium sp.]|uniref:hypothetical protein n=1 Tax=uncultured Amnibacterium sp. TaxID=1631851 RepID=UPI0035CBDFC1